MVIERLMYARGSANSFPNVSPAKARSRPAMSDEQDLIIDENRT